MSLESLLERLRGEAVTPKPIEDALMGEHEDTDPDPAAFLVALATPNGTCEVTVPRDQYDPEAVATMVDRCRALPVDKNPGRWRSAEIMAPGGQAIKATTPNGWGQTSWQCLARAYFPRGNVVHALESVGLVAAGANIPDTSAHVPIAEAADAEQVAALRTFFAERAAVLEHGGGLPRPEAELEAARTVGGLARNRGYLWASLREALSGYPELLARLPSKGGPVDAAPFGLAAVHVREDGVVLRQGEFVGVQEVRPKMTASTKRPLEQPC